LLKENRAGQIEDCHSEARHYLASYKNVGRLFEKIETAKAPEAFTTRFLADVIGLKSPAARRVGGRLIAL
jgi:hypothetical protein